MSERTQGTEDLARRMAWLEWRLHWAEWKIGELERFTGIPQEAPQAKAAAPRAEPAPVPAGAEVAPPESHPAPGPPDVNIPAPAASSPAPQVVESAPEAVLPVAPAHAPPPPAPFDWESLIGVRLFAWLGGVALFVAAALFLNYSIQQNLISPGLRVMLGLGFGALALAGGDRLRTQADRAGQALAGGGVATLYASLYAAYSLYHLVASPVAFGGMVVVTAVAGLMAVRRDAFMLAVLGLLGGFATPYLVSTGEDRPLALFAYTALLNSAVVVVASRKRWPGLAMLGLAGSGLLFAGWASAYLDTGKAPYALFAAAVLCGIFAVAAPVAWHREGASSSSAIRFTAAVAAVLPLLLALLVAGDAKLEVAPPVLVAYLLLLSVGSWFAGRRVELAMLAPIAAGFGAATLLLRTDATLFPVERTGTLGFFALFPLGWFALWFARRKAPEGKTLAVAAALAQVAGLLVLARVLILEDATQPPWPLALYAWLHVAILLALGALGETSAPLLGALALSFLATLFLAFGSSASRVDSYVPLASFPVAVYLALPLLGAPFRRDLRAWCTSAAGVALHYAVLYGVTLDTWGDNARGAVAIVCGVALLGTSWRARGADERGRAQTVVAATGLLFLTVAVPIVLRNEWVTIIWALEAAALAALRVRVPHRGLLVASTIVAAAVLLRLLANPEVLDYHPRTGTPIFNWWLYGYGLPAASLLVAWDRLRRDDEAKRAHLPPLFAAAGGVVLFALVNLEIADLYSTGSRVSLELTGGGFQKDMTYTLAWGVFALALFGVGMAGGSRGARIGAIVLVCVTVAKGALHDVWALGALYRVGAIVGLAATLLAVSYLTQRFVLQGGPRPPPRQPPP